MKQSTLDHLRKVAGIEHVNEVARNTRNIQSSRDIAYAIVKIIAAKNEIDPTNLDKPGIKDQAIDSAKQVMGDIQREVYQIIDGELETSIGRGEDPIFHKKFD